jgi:hypothetical protein
VTTFARSELSFTSGMKCVWLYLEVEFRRCSQRHRMVVIVTLAVAEHASVLGDDVRLRVIRLSVLPDIFGSQEGTAMSKAQLSCGPRVTILRHFGERHEGTLHYLVLGCRSQPFSNIKSAESCPRR